MNRPPRLLFSNRVLSVIIELILKLFVRNLYKNTYTSNIFKANISIIYKNVKEGGKEYVDDSKIMPKNRFK